MSDRSRTMEPPEQRSGDNLYPVKLTQEYGEHVLELDVPAGVWNPTPHGVQLGRMLLELDFTGEHVLELGTGCGIHAILIARRGAARMTVTEIDQHVNDNAAHNLEKHGVEIPVEHVVADWTNLKSASHDGGPYDSLVSNPPFAKSGKRYRRHFIDALILDTHKLVRPGGRLIMVQSSMADIPRTISFMGEHGMSVRVVGETEGPFRDYYFEDDEFLREMAAIPGGYAVRDGIHYERLIVLEARVPG